MRVLHRNGLRRPDELAVIIQSFETANLRKLSRLTDVRLVQLLDAAGRAVRLRRRRRRPHLRRTWSRRPACRGSPGTPTASARTRTCSCRATPPARCSPPTTVVRDAHRAGLVVHAWTFRAENQFLPLDFRIGTDPDARGDVTAEYELFLRLGLDGVFSDHPDTAVAAVNAVRRHRQPAT